MRNGETIRFINDLRHRLRMRRIKWIREQLYCRSIVPGALKAAMDISNKLDDVERIRELDRYLLG